MAMGPSSELQEMFGQAFGAFDGYGFLMMVLVSIGAAFTMRSVGSLITATIAALVVFATLVFMRNVASTALASGDTVQVVQNDWNDLLTLQFSTLCVYALVFGIVVVSSYAVLSFTRQ
jgi:hypothetical protein